MKDEIVRAAEDGGESDGRRSWISPSLQELPRLTDLTLQSFIPGGGIPGGGGSTVF